MKNSDPTKVDEKENEKRQKFKGWSRIRIRRRRNFWRMVTETFGPQPRLSSAPEIVTYLKKTLSCEVFQKVLLNIHFVQCVKYASCALRHKHIL